MDRNRSNQRQNGGGFPVLGGRALDRKMQKSGAGFPAPLQTIGLSVNITCGTW